jgi:hypothetical protein
MDAKYLGYFSTNEGTHNRTGFEFNSKKRACKDMREIAQGNCLHGSSANWKVTDFAGNVIKAGKVQ